MRRVRRPGRTRQQWWLCAGRAAGGVALRRHVGLYHGFRDGVMGGGRSVDIVIRPEDTGDRDAVWHVNRVAFGQDGEALLVDALREGGYVRVSLVAETAGQVV